MSYTPTDWKTGDVITAEKLNNMESGIVSGQNNVEFVKIFSNLAVSVTAGSPMTSAGGMFTEQKSLGELIGEKTIIGLTSVFHYDPSGGTSGTPDKYTSNVYPVDTQLRFPLWEHGDHLADESSGLTVYLGIPFHVQQ